MLADKNFSKVHLQIDAELTRIMGTPHEAVHIAPADGRDGLDGKYIFGMLSWRFLCMPNAILSVLHGLSAGTNGDIYVNKIRNI